MSSRINVTWIVLPMLLCACGNASNGGPGATGGGSSGAGGNSGGGAGNGGTAGACFADRVAPARIALDGITGCAIDSTASLRCWGNHIADYSSAPAGSFVEINGRADVYGALTKGFSVAYWGHTGSSVPPAPGFSLSQIAVNGSILCAIGTCGALTCWPSVPGDKDGLSIVPPGLFRQVSVGGRHACALDESGALQCWGSDIYGQTEAPSGSFTFVTSGDYHSCALAGDGHVECWGAKDVDAGQGSADFGQAAPPSGSFKYLSAGELHTCGIKDDDTVACWGLGTSNADCQGKTECGQAMPPAGTFQQIASGFTNTCGIRLDGSLACWGSDTGGRSTPPADFK